MRNVFIVLLSLCLSAIGAELQDAGLQSYFAAEVARISSDSLSGIETKEQWVEARPKFREQLFEMLSLSPLPEKTELKPIVTGRIERSDVIVEKLHFQSMPGLYVTANLYLPKTVEKPLPTILYVCGHAILKTNGISFGNKAGYQHHGAWFARNGYACLIIDTLQLGEIEGIHHGTHREGMWWWNSRGYTSAGVEAWNCIRALDYLETRPEVDKTHFGVTGRSGGGAYSWWVTALDDRIKVSAPVAGITDLENHVVDGVVEGHCDCMYIVNTYRWDYPVVAALAAPRPLLICNSDKDRIFPLDGVQRVHQKVASIYELHKAADKLGLLITEGPHKDTQDLQLPVFRWFNRHLKGEDPLIEIAAQKLFAPHELKVFEKLPEDELNTKIQESFVPMAERSSLGSHADWPRDRAQRLAGLKHKVFRGWPDAVPSFKADREKVSAQIDWNVERIQFDSQEHVRLEMHLLTPKEAKPNKLLVYVLNESEWQPFRELLGSGVGASAGTRLVIDRNPNAAVIFFAPRGIGSDAWAGDAKKQVQIRRRFMLAGQTVDSMRVWDICRALDLLSDLPETSGLPREAHASGFMAVNLTYASLYTPLSMEALRLDNMPASHMEGPDYLNVLRVMDIPDAVEMVKKSGIKVFESDVSGGHPRPNQSSE